MQVSPLFRSRLTDDSVCVDQAHCRHAPIGQWDKLVLYASHGEVYIDNAKANLVENAIRPFVLGRKNWLFSDLPDGASASAFWFSLILTAKANGKDPYKFLLPFLKGLPFCKNTAECENLFFDSMGWV